MQKLLPVLVFLATASAFSHGSTAVEVRFAAGVSGAGNAVVLVGGMGGGTGGGMGGGMGGMSGGMTGFGGTPSNSSGNTYEGVGSSGGGAQPAQYYLCVTPYDRCSLASSPGSVRSGSSCTCSTGHRGTIK
jgi:hypothetical protein